MKGLPGDRRAGRGVVAPVRRDDGAGDDGVAQLGRDHGIVPERSSDRVRTDHAEARGQIDPSAAHAARRVHAHLHVDADVVAGHPRERTKVRDVEDVAIVRRRAVEPAILERVGVDPPARRTDERVGRPSVRAGVDAAATDRSVRGPEGPQAGLTRAHRAGLAGVARDRAHAGHPGRTHAHGVSDAVCTVGVHAVEAGNRRTRSVGRRHAAAAIRVGVTGVARAALAACAVVGRVPAAPAHAGVHRARDAVVARSRASRITRDAPRGGAGLACRAQPVGRDVQVRAARSRADVHRAGDAVVERAGARDGRRRGTTGTPRVAAGEKDREARGEHGAAQEPVGVEHDEPR